MDLPAILYIIHIYHHTVQVAICTLVNEPVLREKYNQCKLQWAMTTMSASGVFVLADESAQGQHLNANLALVLPAFGCCILLL